MFFYVATCDEEEGCVKNNGYTGSSNYTLCNGGSGYCYDNHCFDYTVSAKEQCQELLNWKFNLESYGNGYYVDQDGWFCRSNGRCIYPDANKSVSTYSFGDVEGINCPTGTSVFWCEINWFECSSDYEYTKEENKHWLLSIPQTQQFHVSSTQF